MDSYFWTETELNIKYVIEKCNVICDNCILRYDSCNICVHTFKCSCIDNVLYFNICNHIHGIAKLTTDSTYIILVHIFFCCLWTVIRIYDKHVD